MQTFSRLLSVVTLILSFGFLAHALPVPATGNALASRQYSTPESYGNNNNGGSSYGSNSNSGSDYGNDSSYGSQADQSVDVLSKLSDLQTTILPYLDSLTAAQDLAAAQVAVTAVVVAVKACASSLTGVTAEVAADVKAKIAQICLDIFIAIVTACAAVSVKLGVSVCLALWAQIDVALHLLFLTLNVCVGGLLQVIVALFASLDVAVLAKLKVIHLDLCVQILVLVAKISGIAN